MKSELTDKIQRYLARLPKWNWEEVKKPRGRVIPVDDMKYITGMLCDLAANGLSANLNVEIRAGVITSVKAENTEFIAPPRREPTQERSVLLLRELAADWPREEKPGPTRWVPKDISLDSIDPMDFNALMAELSEDEKMEVPGPTVSKPAPWVSSHDLLAVANSHWKPPLSVQGLALILSNVGIVPRGRYKDGTNVRGYDMSAFEAAWDMFGIVKP